MNERARNDAGGTARAELPPAGPVFASLIPDLSSRADAYRVNTSEVDGEILALFVEQLRLVVAALAPAVAKREEHGVRSGAHSLLGMGGAIGEPEISVVGAELSAAAMRGDFDRCARLLAALEEWMRQSDQEDSGRGGK